MPVLVLVLGTVSGFRRMIVIVVLGMRSRGIECMRKPRSFSWRLVFFIVILTPAFTFQVEIGCGQ